MHTTQVNFTLFLVFSTLAPLISTTKFNKQRDIIKSLDGHLQHPIECFWRLERIRSLQAPSSMQIFVA